MVAKDKIKHFIVGFLISGIITAIYSSMSGVLTALAVSFFAGIFWEVAQKIKIVRGHADIMDAYATILGGIFGVIPISVMLIVSLF